MKRMKNALWVAVGLATACGSAMAQSYGGAIIGMTRFDVDCTPFTCNKTDTGYKFYGGRHLTDKIAVEMAYTQFGTVRVSGVDSVEASAVSIVGALRLPIWNDVNGVVRLGVAYINKRAKVIESDTTVSAYGGLGLEYAMNKNIKLQAVVDATDHGNGMLYGLGLQADF